MSSAPMLKVQSQHRKYVQSAVVILLFLVVYSCSTRFFFMWAHPPRGLTRHNISLGSENVSLYLVATGKTRAQRIHRLYCFLFTLLVRAHIFALLFKGKPSELCRKNISQHYRYVLYRHKILCTSRTRQLPLYYTHVQAT